MKLRPRRWPIYATAALGVALAGSALYVLFAHQTAKQRGPAVAKILEIEDAGYRACVLGGPVADADFAPKLLEAQLTGALTASKVYACGELAQQKLEALDSLKKDDHALDVFWQRPYREDGGDFGVCAQLELVHMAARDLGVAVANVPCATKLERLAPVVSHLPVMFNGYRIGDDVLLDEPSEDLETRTLRRSRNGTDWQTSEPIRTNSELHASSAGVWAYAVGDKDVHLARLDGDKWIAGLHPPGEVVHWRRTDAGWTFLLEDHGARVWRLDPTMRKVMSDTRIANVWSERANQPGIVAADGTAGVLEARLGKGEVSLEAHVVHLDGKQDAPHVTKLPSKATSLSTATCASPATLWIAIGDTAIVQTRDAGAKSSTQAGDVLVPDQVTCTDDWLVGIAGTQLIICERGACRVRKVPHVQGAELHTHLARHGESARLLVTDDDHAVLYHRDPGGELTLAHAWTWSIDGIPMVVRADDTWFFISG